MLKELHDRDLAISIVAVFKQANGTVWVCAFTCEQFKETRQKAISKKGNHSKKLEALPFTKCTTFFKVAANSPRKN